jgi:hypothetical protein
LFLKLKIILLPKNCQNVSPRTSGLLAGENTEDKIQLSFYWTVPQKLPACSVVCKGCKAYHWPKETTGGDESFTPCCQKNKVMLPSFNKDAPPYPEMLKVLLTGRKPSELTLILKLKG